MRNLIRNAIQEYENENKCVNYSRGGKINFSLTWTEYTITVKWTLNGEQCSRLYRFDGHKKSCSTNIDATVYDIVKNCVQIAIDNGRVATFRETKAMAEACDVYDRKHPVKLRPTETPHCEPPALKENDPVMVPVVGGPLTKLFMPLVELLAQRGQDYKVKAREQLERIAQIVNRMQLDIKRSFDAKDFCRSIVCTMYRDYGYALEQDMDLPEVIDLIDDYIYDRVHSNTETLLEMLVYNNVLWCADTWMDIIKGCRYVYTNSSQEVWDDIARIVYDYYADMDIYDSVMDDLEWEWERSGRNRSEWHMCISAGDCTYDPVHGITRFTMDPNRVQLAWPIMA